RLSLLTFDRFIDRFTHMPDDHEGFVARLGTPQVRLPPIGPRWSVRRGDVEWLGFVRFQGRPFGWEGVVSWDAAWVISRLAPLREQAIQWLDELRRDIERGWLEDQDGAVEKSIGGSNLEHDLNRRR